MAKKLPAWIFLALAMAILGFALVPIARAVFGVDEAISASFLITITLLIAGLMCGLTAMILLVRKPLAITHAYSQAEAAELSRKATLLHLTQFLMFTGVPLLNFLVCYFLWLRWRGESSFLDYHARESLNFQISIYLYLLMTLFLAYILVGVFLALVVLLFAGTLALVAAVWAWQHRLFAYPASIAIVPRQAPVRNG